jgi:tripartite-type tricarboxylate transporter receptor subunit TctC
METNMTFPPVVRTVAQLALGCLLVTANLASAQSRYPDKPVHVIVPYPAGGNTDIIARAVMKEVATRMGQPFVIENKPGANGNIGANSVAKSASDGYTLLVVIGAYANNQVLYKKLPYSPTDLAPVSLMSRTPLVLVASPRLPVNNIDELVQYGKSSDHLSYASSGIGATAHLLGERFVRAAGSKAMHVPYKGSAEAVSDLVSGRVGFMFDAVSAMGSQIRQGKLKAIAVTGNARSPQLPGVPTLAELGYPQLVTYAWAGVLAPAKTPEAITDRLSREIATVLKTPELREKLAAISTEGLGTTPGEFSAFIDEETRIAADIVKSAGISID